MRTHGRRSSIVLVLTGFSLAGAGCIGWGGVDTAILGTLFTEPNFLDTDSGGNVVISYTNRTSRSATWTVTWEAQGADQATVLITQTGPNETNSVCVEGPVKRIALGGQATDAPAVVFDVEPSAPKSVSYEGKALLSGEDFQPGDIISFTVVESASGRWTITTEIISGG